MQEDSPRKLAKDALEYLGSIDDILSEQATAISAQIFSLRNQALLIKSMKRNIIDIAMDLRSNHPDALAKIEHTYAYLMPEGLLAKAGQLERAIGQMATGACSIVIGTLEGFLAETPTQRPSQPIAEAMIGAIPPGRTADPADVLETAFENLAKKGIPIIRLTPKPETIQELVRKMDRKNLSSMSDEDIFSFIKQGLQDKPEGTAPCGQCPADGGCLGIRGGGEHFAIEPMPPEEQPPPAICRVCAYPSSGLECPLAYAPDGMGTERPEAPHARECSKFMSGGDIKL